MRLGVITDEVSQDFEEALKFAKEYGLECVELRSAWEKGPFDYEEEDILKIKQCTDFLFKANSLQKEKGQKREKSPLLPEFSNIDQSSIKEKHTPSSPMTRTPAEGVVEREPGLK